MHKDEHLLQLTQLILTKVDRLDTRQDEMDRTLVRNTVSLEEHVKRTNLLEAKIEPIEAHVIFMQNGAKWTAKIVAATSGLVGLVAGVYKLISSLA